MIFERVKIAGQIGSFVTRPAVYIDMDMRDYWAMKAVTWPVLAAFALALANTAVSEAAVERSFSAQGQTYTELRARATEETVEAQMWIKMNHTAVHNPAKAERQAAKRFKIAAQKREKAQADIDDLWAKRAKK